MCFLPSNNFDCRKYKADSLVSFNNHFATYKQCQQHTCRSPPKVPFPNWLANSYPTELSYLELWPYVCTKLNLRETYFKVKHYPRLIYFYWLKEGVMIWVLIYGGIDNTTLIQVYPDAQCRITWLLITGQITYLFQNISKIDQSNQCPFLKATWL